MQPYQPNQPSLLSPTLSQAIQAARSWVAENAADKPGYLGAYIGGSAPTLLPEDRLPAGSDTDVYLVTSDPTPPPKPGKLIHQGVLLEISFVSWQQLFPPERSLSNYHLANSLRYCCTIDDPEGRLAPLQQQVANQFSSLVFLAARRDQAIERVYSGLTGIRYDRSLPDLVLSWLFPMGITTHAILTAAQKNPTVRLRYLRAREVMQANGMEQAYQQMLSFPGLDLITPELAGQLLDRLEPLYDLAARIGHTPLPYSTDISPLSRFTAIQASRTLIAEGAHREITFWTLTTYARAMKVLLTDAPDGYRQYLPCFEQALQSVGRLEQPAVQQAVADALAFLPRLRQLTDRLINLPAE